MTKEYTPFPISNFRSGFNQAVEPWLLPRDAFQVLNNAHLYRGVVEKIPGYNLYARMSYRKIYSTMATGVIDGVNKVFTGTLDSLPTTNNITIQSTIDAAATLTETFVDNGTGVLMGSNGGSATINYSTGAFSITFGTNAPADLTVGGIQYNSILISYDSIPYAVGFYKSIMAIKPYLNPNGSQDILIFDEVRAGKIVELLANMSTLQQFKYGISEIPHEKQLLNITTGFNGTVGPYTGNLALPLIPGSVTFNIWLNSSENSQLIGVITDNGAGLLTSDTNAIYTAQLNPAALSLINYSTGQWTMTFLPAAGPIAPPIVTNTMNFSGCLYGDTFTGDFTNFFDVVNYQGKAFATNFIDPPMYYDGSCLKFLDTSLSPNSNATMVANDITKLNKIAPYDIGRALHVVVYRERLLLASVFVRNIPELNTIYWSAVQDSLNFTNGEFLPATTSEYIRTLSIINSDLIVRFSNSERVFRYTSDAFSPFRWDSTNVLWRCDASYSAINYDSWFSSVGRPAIVGSDGVNVKRVDEIIPDFTLNARLEEQQPVHAMDQGSIGQCYGERFDDFKEGWLCYRDYDEDSEDIVTVRKSNSVLAFNYLDGTYAVYQFPFSVLGFGRIIAEDVWGNNYDKWGGAGYTWDSYSQSETALVDLAGDHNGVVYVLGEGNGITTADDPTGTFGPFSFEAITKSLNPFIEEGELVRFGYVDFLVSANDNTKFRVQFYKDDKLNSDFDSYYQETTLTLTGIGQSKVWKRVYVGAVGKEHTMRIYQSLDDFTVDTIAQPLRIHSMVPWMKAAGRIFN